MERGAESSTEALLPRGGWDAARQLALFAAAYGAYSVVRGLVATSGTRPFADARRVIALERALHVFVEPAIQAWATHRHPLLAAAVVVYLDAHVMVSAGALVFIYLRRRDAFPLVRNAAMIAMAIALVAYAAFPTAPPRMLPRFGFTDPLPALDPHGAASAFVNVYAAVPSMHVCFALLVGLAMARLVSRSWARALWLLYPVLITLVVLVTGNHFICDVVLGALTAVASRMLARAWLARARPGLWTFAQRSPYCPDRSHA